MNRLCWVVLATAILLCGCATKPPDPGVITTSSYFGGATKGHLDCDVKECPVAVAPSCVSSGACGGKVDYDPIDLKNQNMNVKVSWTLEKGYVFCKLLGDGVFLKENTDQFRPEPPNPNDAKCSDTYFVTAINSKSRPERPYQYKIQFHKVTDATTMPVTLDSTSYLIDPSMVNK